MKRAIKIVSVIIITLIISLILIYNFGTSQYCIKKFILPAIAKKTNSEINVKGIKLSLAQSSLKINNLKYSSPGLNMESEKLIIKTSLYDLLFKHKINIRKFLVKDTNLALDLSSPKVVAMTPTTTAKKQEEKNNGPTKETSRKGSLYKVSLNDISVENLNIQIKNNEKITKVDNLALQIPNIEPKKQCTVNLNGKMSMIDGKKLIKGFIRSKSVVTLNDRFLPTYIDSDSLIKLNDNETPLVLRLNTSEDKSFNFSSEISNISIGAFASAFIMAPYDNTKGEINRVELTASGQDINDLVYGTNPINSTALISGINISSEGNFYIKNKSIRLALDLSSAIQGRLLPDDFIIDSLSAGYTSNNQTVAIDNLNLNLDKLAKQKIKAIMNTGFAYKADTKELKGFLTGNIQVCGENILEPESANLKMDLKIDEHTMPIILRYKNNSTTETASINLKRFKISPFKKFFEAKFPKLSGTISDININLSGNGMDGIKKGLQNNSSSEVVTKITAKKINLETKEKYSAVIQSLDTSFDLNKIVSGKYHINSLNIEHPELVIFKNTKRETTSNSNTSSNRPAPKQQPRTTTPSTKKPVQKHYDFDIRNVRINDLYAKIISNKTLVFSDGVINSERIKSDSPSNVDIKLKYTINGVEGSIKASNKFVITSTLLCKSCNSRVELADDNQHVSKLKFTYNQISKHNTPFSIDAEIKKLSLDPFLIAFAPTPYDKMTTNIDTLNLNLKGQDLNNVKTMDGNISSELSNVSLPINVEDKNVIEACFFPLKVLADLSTNTALKFVPGKVSTTINRIDDTFNRKKRIDLKKGKLNVILNSGVVDIKQFKFYGTPENPIEELKLSGEVNLNNSAVNLNTNTILADLVIPLEIGGTIQKPQTDTSKLVATILQKNARNLIDTGTETTNTISETIENIKNKRFDELLRNPSTDKNTGAETKPNTSKTPKQKNLGDAVNDFLDILEESSNNSTSSSQQKTQGTTRKKRVIKLDKAVKDIFNF